MRVHTTSSPALISTCGSIIRRESRLSAVDPFLRLDKVDPLSTDDERDLELLVSEGERADGERSFELDFLKVLPLLLLLSIDEEETLVVPDIDSLSDGFLAKLCLLPSDNVRETLAAGDNGDCFFSTESLVLFKVLVPIAGKEARLGSMVEDRLNESETEVVFFFPTLSTSDLFPANPPVLLLLFTGSKLELNVGLVTAGLIEFELVLETLVPSTLFLLETVEFELEPGILTTGVTPGFTGLTILLLFSAEVTVTEGFLDETGDSRFLV